MKSSTSEAMRSAERTLSRVRPNLFLPQEEWVPQACRAPQGQEAPQVLKEREVPPVNAEPLEVLGQQVSDGSWAGLLFPCAHHHHAPGQS